MQAQAIYSVSAKNPVLRVSPWRKGLPHLLAFLFFVAVSWGWTSFSWNKGVEYIQQSDTAIYYFKVVMQNRQAREEKKLDSGSRWQWSTLISEIWADQRRGYQSSDMDSLYQSSFENYLGTVYRVTGDVTLGYKILVFPLNLIFLLGAYALFFHLTKRVVLSAFLAFLASFPIAIPIAGEYFGMGPATIYSRRNFFTAFAPFAIYLFYQWINRPRLLIFVFIFVGFISNLHSSGILLAEILLLTFLLLGDKSFRTWGYAVIYGMAIVLSGFVAIGGLWGRVESFFEAFFQMVVPSAYAAMPGFMQKTGIPEGLQFLFYPLRIYSYLPLTVLHAVTLLVSVLACGALFFGRGLGSRIRTRLLFAASLAVLAYLGFSEFKYMLLLGVAAFALTWKKDGDLKFEITHILILVIFLASFLGMLLFQAGYYTINDFPLVFDQLRGTRFLGLMVYAWLAVLFSRIEWRNSGVWGRRLFIICVALAVLTTLRQDFRSWIRIKIDPASVALLDVARWSKEHTTKDAKFLVASTRFGIVAERNVFIHDRESRTIQGQAVLKQLQGEYSGLLQLAQESSMSYIVVKKDQVRLPADVHPVYENQRYALVKVDYPS